MCWLKHTHTHTTVQLWSPGSHLGQNVSAGGSKEGIISHKVFVLGCQYFEKHVSNVQ